MAMCPEAKQGIAAVIQCALREKRTGLTELESKDVLRAMGVAVTRHLLVRDADAAVSAAQEIGYPVVLKIVSPAILHKTDVGCVELDLQGADKVRAAHARILKKGLSVATADQIHGVAVQEMALRGQEVIVGLKRDAVFGPTLLFGLGGVWVELVKDISLRVLPCTRWDLEEMIQEIRGARLLNGYRGAPPADTTVIADILERVAELAQAFPEIQEMDLNPIFVYEDGHGARVIDARILIRVQDSEVK